MRPITSEQREALKAIAEQAKQAAELIHQHDQRAPGTFQAEAPRGMLRAEGPDEGLQAIEVQLAEVARAIAIYLQVQPPYETGR